MLFVVFCCVATPTGRRDWTSRDGSRRRAARPLRPSREGWKTGLGLPPPYLRTTPQKSSRAPGKGSKERRNDAETVSQGPTRENP
eukprot:4188385-Pyramimonas_sp.AAC.1